MNKNQCTYKLRHLVSSVVMLLALTWLTVSTPFVYAHQQAMEQLSLADEDEIDNPFATTTEEKTESGVNTLSEYLHEHEIANQTFITLTSFYKCHSADVYIAYHPEYVCPPPDVKFA